MKLTRSKTRQVGDQVYYKWVVNVPPDLIDELGWEPGVELEGSVEGNSLRITVKGPELGRK